MINIAASHRHKHCRVHTWIHEIDYARTLSRNYKISSLIICCCVYVYEYHGIKRCSNWLLLWNVYRAPIHWCSDRASFFRRYSIQIGRPDAIALSTAKKRAALFKFQVWTKQGTISKGILANINYVANTLLKCFVAQWISRRWTLVDGFFGPAEFIRNRDRTPNPLPLSNTITAVAIVSFAVIPTCDDVLNKALNCSE